MEKECKSLRQGLAQHQANSVARAKALKANNIEQPKLENVKPPKDPKEQAAKASKAGGKGKPKGGKDADKGKGKGKDKGRGKGGKRQATYFSDGARGRGHGRGRARGKGRGKGGRGGKGNGTFTNAGAKGNGYQVSDVRKNMKFQGYSANKVFDPKKQKSQLATQMDWGCCVQPCANAFGGSVSPLEQ